MSKNVRVSQREMWTPEERHTSASLTLGTSRAQTLYLLCFHERRFGKK